MLMVVADIFGRGPTCVSCPSELWHNRLLWTRTTQSRLRYFPHSSNALRKRISWRSASPHRAPTSPTSRRAYRLCTKRRLSGGYPSGPEWPNFSISESCGGASTMMPSRIMSTAKRPSMTSAPLPHRPGAATTAGIVAIRHLCPYSVFTLGQAGPFRQPPRVFRCARAVAGHRDSGRHRNSDLRRRAPPKNREDWGPRRPDAPDHRRDRGDLPRPGAAPAGPEQALRRLRLPAKVSRPRHRTRRFEPAQRDDRQGAGKIQCEGNLLDNAAVVRLPPAPAQAQQT